MSRESIATLLVVLPMVVVSAGIGWWAFGHRNGADDAGVAVFNLTGVGSDLSLIHI